MLHSVFKFRYWLLGLTLVVGILLFQPLLGCLQVNNSLTVWFLEDAPALKVYREFQDRFGGDETIIMLFGDEEGVLREENVDKLKNLSVDLMAHPDVAATFSLANQRVLEGSSLNFRVSEFFYVGATEEELIQRANDHGWIRDHFLNEDFTATRLLVQLKPSPDLDIRRGEILKDIKGIANQYLTEDQVAYGGVAMIFEGLNELSQQEFTMYLGVAYVAMFIILAFLYRNIKVVVLSLGVIILASYLTLGIYGLLGLQLNIMTTLIPVILSLLGLIDVIHIVNDRVILQVEDTTPTEKTLKALRKVWKPCLFTTLTTMAGFMSLLASPMPILRQFGLFSAIGVFLCLVFSFLLTMIIMPSIANVQSFQFRLGRVGTYMDKPRPGFVIATVLIIIFSAIGATRLHVDTYTLGYLPSDHPVVKDHERIVEAWGDYMPLDFMIKLNDSLGIADPKILDDGLALTEAWTQLPIISGVLGFPNLIDAGLQARYGGSAERARNSARAIESTTEQIHTFYPNLHAFMVDSTETYGRITLYGAMTSAQDLKVILDTLLSEAEVKVGDHLEVTPAGYLPMYADIITYVTESQIQSLLLALALIFILVWTFIRRLRLAWVTLLCNLFPVLVLFGAIGWFGIDLDLATASIAAIGLSFCIDDSIHFIYSYHEGRVRGLSRSHSQKHTFRKIGAAIIVSSLILICGYSLMMFAELKTVYLFGGFTALMVLAALYAQFIIFPILIRWMDKE